MKPTIVVNNESLVNGLPEMDFVRTYQHRKNKIVANKVIKNWKQYNYIAHDDLGLFSWNYFDELFDYSNYYYMVSYPCEFYSTSIGPAAVCSEVVDGIYQTQSPVLSYEQLLGLASRRIRVLRENLNVKLSFENTAFRAGNDAYKYVTEPEFISSLVNDNDVGFTLDIAHALITARTTGISVHSYLNNLPLGRCGEIHISTPDGVVDSHELPDSYIMDLFGDIKPEIEQDAYVVVEYYRDMKKIKDFYENVLKGFI